MIPKTPFDSVILDAIELYKKHMPEKGLSWLTCSTSFLKDKLDEEYKEVFILSSIFDKKELRKELLDLINVAMMLAKRLE